MEPLKWDFYQDKRGKWRWRAKSKNGQIVGASTQGYATVFDCERNARWFGW